VRSSAVCCRDLLLLFYKNCWNETTELIKSVHDVAHGLSSDLKIVFLLSFLRFNLRLSDLDCFYFYREFLKK